MVEHEVKRGGAKTVVSITIKEPSQFSEFQYRMLKENQVDGILKLDRSIQNEAVVYDYEISGMCSFEEKNQAKKLNGDEIREIYRRILSIVLTAEEYFLEKDSFIIAEEFVYYHEASHSYQLMYCPEYKREIKEQFSDFTEYIMNHIGYEEQSVVAMVYEAFKMFRDGHSTLKDVLIYLTEDQERASVQNHNPMNAPVQPLEQPLYKAFEPMPSAERKEDAHKKNGISAKKLLLYSASICVGLGVFIALYLSGMLFAVHTKKLDMTKMLGVVLMLGAVIGYACYRISQTEMKEKPEQLAEEKCEQPQPFMQQEREVPQPCGSVNPSMQSGHDVTQSLAKSMQGVYTGTKKKQYTLVNAEKNQGQKYILYKMPYLVGKSSEQVDGVIYSEAVSRVHAEFIMENNQLYVMDMSSTNGTYVNKRRICSNQRIAINPGDEIQIADKQFQLIS